MLAHQDDGYPRCHPPQDLTLRVDSPPRPGVCEGGLSESNKLNSQPHELEGVVETRGEGESDERWSLRRGKEGREEGRTDVADG